MRAKEGSKWLKSIKRLVTSTPSSKSGNQKCLKAK